MSDDLLARFVEEGRELAEAAARGLLALERDPAARATLDAVFRAFHTLKGGAGIVGLAPLERLLHAAETRLEAWREGAAAPDAAPLLAAVAEAERWLDAIAAGAPTGPLHAAVATVTARLDVATATARPDGATATARPDGATVTARPEVATATARLDSPAVPAPGEGWAAELLPRARDLGARSALRYRPGPDAYFRGEDPLALLRAVPGLAWMEASAEAAPGPPAAYAPFECRLGFRGLSTASPEAVRQALRLVPDEAEVVGVEVAAPAAAQRTLRVDAAVVEAVGALLDDLVIARNALWHGMAQGSDVALRQAALDRALAALHERVAALRLAPAGPVLGRVAVQARALAATLGRRLRIDITGEGLAIDKAILDGLFEPLLHVVRNAVDHGIEPPEERIAAGKPAEAALSLHAEARGGEAVIAVADDGRGIDSAAVRRIAAARGLVAAEEGMTEAAVLDLVFAPGFSTAREVTAVSGRGVGLDAVRGAIARLGGRVGLETTPGRGTTLRIAVPLRAVLARVAVAEAGGERFGIPVAAILEVRRLRPEEVTAIRLGRAILHRDRVVPVVRLAALLGLDDGPMTETMAVLVGAAETPVAIAVAALGARVEAPMRPVWGPLATLSGLQGAMVEGDGRVLLVLDPAALVA